MCRRWWILVKLKIRNKENNTEKIKIKLITEKQTKNMDLFYNLDKRADWFIVTINSRKFGQKSSKRFQFNEKNLLQENEKSKRKKRKSVEI